MMTYGVYRVREEVFVSFTVKIVFIDDSSFPIAISKDPYQQNSG